MLITPLMRSFGYKELPDYYTHRRWVIRGLDSYTYFAQGLWTGRIKIGRSNSPWRRANELIRSANGEEAELLVAVPCESLEGFYHREFKEHAHGNEWFLPHPDILDEIALHLPSEISPAWLEKTLVHSVKWGVVSSASITGGERR